MIRIPSHIQRSRHGIWFFRIVVPKHLRKAFDGRGEIKKSLGTRDMRQALRVARPLAFHAYDLFAKIEALMSGQEPTPESVIAGFANSKQLKTTITSRSGTSVTLEEESNDPAKLAVFRAEAALARAEAAAESAKYIEKPIAVPEAMSDYLRQQAEEMAKFKAALAEHPVSSSAEFAQPDGHDDDDLPKFRPNPENVISLRWEQYVKQSEGNNWGAARTTKSSRSQFLEFQEWFGKDVDIRFITRKVYNKFLNFLENDRKILSGARKGESGLNIRTIDNYTTTINGFLEWAQNKGYFPEQNKLPTAGQAKMKKAARLKKARKSNPAYTLAQLVKLFDPKAYQFNLAHHFWPPLIALFTGARRREIAQLLLSDFRVVSGIPAFSINVEEDEDKSIKTEAAKRLIPVHPELIAIGLLDYVEDVRALDIGPELFPGIGTDVHGEKGNAIGNAWRRYRETHKMAGKRAPTFHSFRASVIQVLKDNDVTFEMRCQLAGHEIGHVSQHYDNTPINITKLMKYGIPNLRYDGLDLSNIRYQPKQFDQANIKGEKKVIASEKRIAAKQAADAKARKG